ncbi:MAG: hypothetical protein AMJ53_04030 [Gammaproteobacteria bacterium SG8_11]|nr:MAG: hypothetical protein AMJ53_04030 [Gammaproteobacteria bacterium SG8_11]
MGFYGTDSKLKFTLAQQDLSCYTYRREYNQVKKQFTQHPSDVAMAEVAQILHPWSFVFFILV